MSDKTEAPEAPEAEKQAAPPEVPQEEKQPVLADDGIGLTFEQVAALLALKHEVAVGLNDPVMMMVTLHNAFLAEEQKLFRKHDAGFAELAKKYEAAAQRFISAETGRYLQALAEVGDKLAAVLDEGLDSRITRYLTAISGLRRDLYWLTGACALSAICNGVILLVR